MNDYMSTWGELNLEIARQDTKHGPRFSGDTDLGRIRLGICCVEDETRELRDAWRGDRTSSPPERWANVREEALQVAAVAFRLVRQIDAERDKVNDR